MVGKRRAASGEWRVASGNGLAVAHACHISLRFTTRAGVHGAGAVRAVKRGEVQDKCVQCHPSPEHPGEVSNILRRQVVQVPKGEDSGGSGRHCGGLMTTATVTGRGLLVPALLASSWR